MYLLISSATGAPIHATPTFATARRIKRDLYPSARIVIDHSHASGKPRGTGQRDRAMTSLAA